MTVTLLYRTHTAHRAARADEIDRYFSEQWTYRQSILAMHAAFVASGVAASELLTGNNLLAAELDARNSPNKMRGDGAASPENKQTGRTRPESPEHVVTRAARRMFAKGGEDDDAHGITIQTPQAVIRRKPAPAS